MVNHPSPSNSPSYNSNNDYVNDSDFPSNNNFYEENNEPFTNLSGNMGINVDLVLKSIFYGAIFYLLSLPDVYKMTAGVVGKRVDGVLVHGIVFAVLYYILTHFI
jgi:hypothetical protein